MSVESISNRNKSLETQKFRFYYKCSNLAFYDNRYFKKQKICSSICSAAVYVRFMREMSEKEHEKDATITLAHQILAKAHPDGATVIKHWITIIQARWDEVSTWARQVSLGIQGLK